MIPLHYGQRKVFLTFLGWFLLSSRYREDWAESTAHHLLRHAPDQHVQKAGSSVTAHDNHVGCFPRRFFEDLFVGDANFHILPDSRPGEELGEVLCDEGCQLFLALRERFLDLWKREVAIDPFTDGVRKRRLFNRDHVINNDLRVPRGSTDLQGVGDAGLR